MARTRPPYAPEFRRQIVELVRAGRTAEELSREFEPTAQTIHNWVGQADRDEGLRSWASSAGSISRDIRGPCRGQTWRRPVNAR